ncbi:MAG TPA: hypothetical protein ENK54_03975 [Thiotrichales bacterium]|nr:hypothetical protein [Thiotrichales bacterium]
MKKTLLGLFAPPLAVCRYACASCCAAPIGVFWITGIVSMLYGLEGGPLGQPGISWPTIVLGIMLWSISTLWAIITLRNVEERTEECPGCLDLNEEEPNPLDEVRKAH